MVQKTRGPGRRRFIQGAGLSAGSAAVLLAGLGVPPALAQAAGSVAGRSGRKLKAAFSNAGLQATWCAQGKRAAEYWGKLFNVEVTWFDGELAAQKQRAAIDNMASQKWDFVAIQAFGIGTLTAPVNKMIDAGIPVIDMDTLIAPLDSINVHSFLAPDNEFMGAAGDPGAGRCDRRQGHDDDDPGRARPYRRAGAGARVSIGGQEISRRSRCWTPSRRTGT